MGTNHTEHISNKTPRGHPNHSCNKPLRLTEVFRPLKPWMLP